MPAPNKKIPKYSFLSITIEQLLYHPHQPRMFLLGIGCALSSLTFSAATYAETVVVSNPDTQSVDRAIQKIEDRQQQKIDDALEQKKLDTSATNSQQQAVQTSVQGFQEDAVYRLNTADIPQANQSMLNEIYQVAEQAQQDAHKQEPSLPTVTQVIQSQRNSNISNDLAINDTNVQDVNVDQLQQQLQQQTVQSSDFQVNPNAYDPSNPQQSDALPEKRGFFARLFNRKNAVGDVARSLPKITVSVTGAPEALEDNIEAKLSSFTVEAFEEFSSALPQLREMTTQAAQAVGYYQAQFKFSKLSNTALRVDVTPNAPTKVTSQDIEITGAGAKRPAFQVIKVVPDLNVGDILNHGKYETTKNRIATAASNLGFFDSYWRMHDVKVTLPENTTDIKLKYETGERYQLNGVEYRMTDPSKPFPLRREVLEKLVPFKDGDDYTSWRVNLLSNNLINSRYFNFALVNAIKPDPIEKPLELPDDLKALVEQDATLKAEQDAQSGDEVLRQSVVNENVFAGSGERSLATAAANENESDETEDDKIKAKARLERRIPVIVYLNADNPNNLETGIGYGTDSGVRLRSQYRRAIVNDRGHSLDSNFELSKIRQAIDVRYMIPYKDPLNDYINLLGGYEREVRDRIGLGVKLDIESAVLGVERSIKKPLGDWQQTMSLRYRLDRITSEGLTNIDDLPNAFKLVDSNPEQQSLLAGYEISRTDQDNPVNPTKGFRQSYRVEAGAKSLLTETDMAILNAGWRFIYSLGENADHQFVGRADLGYIVTKNFNQVPYNLRFFAGGDQSIRGYDYKSLSPQQQNLLVGGQTLAVGSLEYNYQFKEGWRAAVFTDVGNAYDKDFSTPTKYGVGLGIRWASPVGPIRVDVGAGISEDSIPVRLHFFIGPPL